MASGSNILPNGAHSTQGLVQANQTRLLVPGIVTPPAQIATGPGQRDPETFFSLRCFQADACDYQACYSLAAFLFLFLFSPLKPFFILSAPI